MKKENSHILLKVLLFCWDTFFTVAEDNSKKQEEKTSSEKITPSDRIAGRKRALNGGNFSRGAQRKEGNEDQEDGEPATVAAAAGLKTFQNFCNKIVSDLYEEAEEADDHHSSSDFSDSDEEDGEQMEYEDVYSSEGLFYFCSTFARVEKPTPLILRASNNETVLFFALFFKNW